MSSSKKISSINNINELNKYLNTSNEFSSVIESLSLLEKIDYYENKLKELQDTLTQQQEELLLYSNQDKHHKIICPEEIELKGGSDRILDLKKMDIVNQEINNINDLLNF